MIPERVYAKACTLQTHLITPELQLRQRWMIKDLTAWFKRKFDNSDPMTDVVRRLNTTRTTNRDKLIIEVNGFFKGVGLGTKGALVPNGGIPFYPLNDQKWLLHNNECIEHEFTGVQFRGLLVAGYNEKSEYSFSVKLGDQEVILYEFSDLFPPTYEYKDVTHKYKDVTIDGALWSLKLKLTQRKRNLVARMGKRRELQYIDSLFRSKLKHYKPKALPKLELPKSTGGWTEDDFQRNLKDLSTPQIRRALNFARKGAGGTKAARKQRLEDHFAERDAAQAAAAPVNMLPNMPNFDDPADNAQPAVAPPLPPTENSLLFIKQVLEREGLLAFVEEDIDWDNEHESYRQGHAYQSFTNAFPQIMAKETGFPPDLEMVATHKVTGTKITYKYGGKHSDEQFPYILFDGNRIDFILRNDDLQEKREIIVTTKHGANVTLLEPDGDCLQLKHLPAFDTDAKIKHMLRPLQNNKRKREWECAIQTGFADLSVSSKCGATC